MSSRKRSASPSSTRRTASDDHVESSSRSHTDSVPEPSTSRATPTNHVIGGAFMPASSVVVRRNGVPPTKKPTPRSYSYVTIDKVKEGDIINVWGVVKYFQGPQPTRGTDHRMMVSIADHTCDLQRPKLKCMMFFRDVSTAPKVKCVGDIIRLHRVKVCLFRGELQGNVSPGFSSLVFDGQVDGSLEPRTSANTYVYTDEDRATLKKLREWNASRVRDADDKVPLGIMQLKHAYDDCYFDLVCQVVATAIAEPGTCVVLRVWDGTKLTLPWRAYEFSDHPHKVDNILLTRSEGLAVDVWIYDDHYGNACRIQPGDFIKVTNLHSVRVKDSLDFHEVELVVHRGFSYGRSVRLLTQTSVELDFLKRSLSSVPEVTDSDQCLKAIGEMESQNRNTNNATEVLGYGKEGRGGDTSRNILEQHGQVEVGVGHVRCQDKANAAERRISQGHVSGVSAVNAMNDIVVEARGSGRDPWNSGKAKTGALSSEAVLKDSMLQSSKVTVKDLELTSCGLEVFFEDKGVIKKAPPYVQYSEVFHKQIAPALTKHLEDAKRYQEQLSERLLTRRLLETVDSNVETVVDEQLTCLQQSASVVTAHHHIRVTKLCDVIAAPVPGKFRVFARLAKFSPHTDNPGVFLMLQCPACLSLMEWSARSMLDTISDSTQSYICMKCASCAPGGPKSKLKPLIFMKLCLKDATGEIVVILSGEEADKFFGLSALEFFSSRHPDSLLVQLNDRLELLVAGGMTKASNWLDCCVMSCNRNNVKYHMFDTQLVD